MILHDLQKNENKNRNEMGGGGGGERRSGGGNKNCAVYTDKLRVGKVRRAFFDVLVTKYEDRLLTSVCHRPTYIEKYSVHTTVHILRMEVLSADQLSTAYLEAYVVQ